MVMYDLLDIARLSNNQRTVKKHDHRISRDRQTNEHADARAPPYPADNN